MTLSSRDRRMLLVGVSMIGSLAVLTRGVPAWRTWVSETKAGAEEQMRAAADADALVREGRAMRDTLAARNARYIALAPTLIAGNTPAEASATLASLVSATASAAGVQLGAVQLRPAVDTGPRYAFVRIGVHADLLGDVSGITTLLAHLERGPVRLRVHDFAVTQPDAAAPNDRPEILHVDLTVEGLALHHTGKTP